MKKKKKKQENPYMTKQKIANNYLSKTAKKNVATGRQFIVAAPKVADVKTRA